MLVERVWTLFNNTEGQVICWASILQTPSLVGSDLPAMSFANTIAENGLTGNDALVDADPNHDGIDRPHALASRNCGVKLIGLA